MKKIISGIILLGASSTAMAVSPGGPGCGWGNMLFAGDSGPMHFAASTTNGTSGNATFGMTSGTNGCSTSGSLTYGGKSMIGSIMNELSEDVAKGEGDALTAVAVMYGIEQDDRQAFADATHNNFASIFPSENVTADEVMASLNEIIKSDTRLAKYAI